MFTYDDNVPAPSRSKTSRKGYSDAIRGLPAGMSMYLPTSVSSARSLIYVVVALGERRKGELIARTEGDGCRIWRLAADGK